MTPTTPTKSENAPGRAKPAPRKRAPKAAPAPVKVARKPATREQALAQAANAYALAKRPASFGAPVSAAQVAYYEDALKTLRKKGTNAAFLGFRSNDAALRALRPVAQGTASAAQLPKPTKDAFDKLYQRLNLLHAKDNKVNKTWPRKHAIVLAAILSEKAARKPAAKKPATPAEAPAS